MPLRRRFRAPDAPTPDTAGVFTPALRPGLRVGADGLVELEPGWRVGAGGHLAPPLPADYPPERPVADGYKPDTWHWWTPPKTIRQSQIDMNAPIGWDPAAHGCTVIDG